MLTLAFIFRAASLIRNAKLKPKSNLQTAIGIKHSHISQRSMGFMGGSFNTREFFHGVPQWLYLKLKWIFLILVFMLPALIYLISLSVEMPTLYHLAIGSLFSGLVIERWFFFAQANHPQNLYYQTIG